MRIVASILALTGLFSAAASAGDGTCASEEWVARSSCAHMCPVARLSTKAGHEIVAGLSVAVVEEAELVA